jgi:hypothetical protein
MTETIVETIEEELERFRDKLAEGVAIAVLRGQSTVIQ